MALYEIISSLIALVAVVISLIALIRTRDNSSKLLALEEVHAELSLKQLELIEENKKADSKANLSVSLKQLVNGKKFIITNNGLSEATNISFCLTENNEYDPLIKDDCDKKLPFPRLNHNEDFKLIASISQSVSQSVFEIELKWLNGDGTQSEKIYCVSR